MSGAEARDASWWLEEGTEECAACHGWHHYEISLHCEACDAPTCPTCSVEVRRVGFTVICRRCAEELG